MILPSPLSNQLFSLVTIAQPNCKLYGDCSWSPGKNSAESQLKMPTGEGRMHTRI
jgi:hypothetical protein